ncbi:MAG: hypothetical protein M1814_000560 [Vezdaea aestivalis]|nr:MAG: hypothetical protein M1814_000560 [Vezdaea aestivalis]
MARSLGFPINDQLIDSFLPSSERLRELREEFSKMTQSKAWAIYSFQEEYGSPPFNKKIVDDTSSALDYVTERKQTIASNHVQMCCFSGPSDPEFTKVKKCFGHLLNLLKVRDPASHTSNKAQQEDDEYSQSTTPLSDDSFKACLESLEFENIDTRLHSIETALKNTCRWLIDEPRFKSWLNEADIKEHHGFFWIRGKPGAGKSTMMKNLYEWLKGSPKGRTVISYFFTARGDELEKTTLGMYRSVVFQILGAAPELSRHVASTYHRKVRFEGHSIEWSIKELQHCLLEIIKNAKPRHFIILIDALDESKEDHVREMVAFFEKLAQEAFEQQSRLNICFSSRYYPRITIPKGIFLRLEEEPEHKSDIAKYVNKELRLPEGKSRRLDKIKSQILERASGVFLWVVLVIKSLIKAYDHGKDLSDIEDLLKKIPDKLEDLFDDMLVRDTMDIPELILLVQWVLFAQRPLSPSELVHVMKLWSQPIHFQPWDSDDWNDLSMKNYITSCSKGLCQISKGRKPSVQFIHETVREYLRDKGLVSLQIDLSISLVGKCHDQLRNCCENYILAFTRREVLDFGDLPIAKSTEAKDKRTSLSVGFPFVNYAIGNLFRHAEAAESSEVSQGDFLSTILEPNRSRLEIWIYLNNVFEPHQIRRYEISTPLLYILSEKGYFNLLSSLSVADFGKMNIGGSGKYRNSLDGAIAYGHHEVVSSLLDVEDWCGLKTTEFAHFLLAKPHSAQSEISRSLMQRDFSFSLSDFQAISVLSKVTNSDFTDLLFAKGLNLHKTYREQGTLLHVAARCGSPESIELLITKGANVEAQTSMRFTPLHAAAHHGSTENVELLITKGANIDARTSIGYTPLHRAAYYGSPENIELLITKGANIEAQNFNGDTPLSLAACYRSTEIVELLIAKGANINAQNSRGNTPLQATACYGSPENIELLITKGANINTQGPIGDTLLHMAAYHGSTENVKLFLAKGANINAQNLIGDTPLHATTHYGSPENIELLITKGANVNARNLNGNTPLHLAVCYRRIKNVELLIAKGANIDDTDRDGYTALHHATIHGLEPSVQSLLEHGAAVDAPTNMHWTSLHFAALFQQELILKKLLESGADIDAVDDFGRNVLQLMRDGQQDPLPHVPMDRFDQIIQLLLEYGAKSS